VASMLMHFETNDFDSWKKRFDSDPAGRRQSATGHSVSQGVDNPNSVFIRVEFRSVDEAKAFRQRLLDSGALEQGDMDLKVGPTIVERAEEVTY
jgi:hypothetical protein